MSLAIFLISSSASPLTINITSCPRSVSDPSRCNRSRIAFLGVVHLVGEIVEGGGQLSAPVADLGNAVADLRQRLIDLPAFRDLLRIK